MQNLTIQSLSVRTCECVWYLEKVNLLQNPFFLFLSKLLAINYSEYFQTQIVFPMYFFFFSFLPERHIVNVHIDSRMYTHTHTCAHQTPDFVFLFSSRSMNKTGVQRLSEKQWETWGVLAHPLCSSSGVFMPQSPCVDLQDYSSLDAHCSENT